MFFLPDEEAVRLKSLPLQMINTGTNTVPILDMRYNQPLVEPPMFPCE